MVSQKPEKNESALAAEDTPLLRKQESEWRQNNEGRMVGYLPKAKMEVRSLREEEKTHHGSHRSCD